MTFDSMLYARRIREHRRRHGLTQVQLAGELVLLSVRLYNVACGANDRLVRSWERGEKRPGPYYRRLLCEFFAATPTELGFHAPLPGHGTGAGASLGDFDDHDDVRRRRFLEFSLAAAVGALDHRLDSPRRSLDLVLARDPIGPDLDEWERTARAYSYELTSTPPERLLANLLADFEDVAQLVGESASESARRRLLHVAGQLAVLAANTLVGMGEHQTARRWWRTARTLSDRAGDPSLAAFVRGQQAALALYGGYLPSQVLELAQETEAASRGRPTAGLAEALGARAQALGTIGRSRDAREALDALARTFDRLPEEVTHESSSYFGWPEHRLRHVESYTYTHLGDSLRAGTAQERTLTLYGPTRWRGPAQIRLHRAACLVADGDVTEGVEYAADVLHGLPAHQRCDGLLQPLARAAMAAAPERARRLPAVQQYEELLALPPGPEVPP